MYIDSHCHINFPDLAARLPEIFGKMAENQVSHALCVSVDLPDFPQVLALAEQYPNVYASVGVHPDYEDTPEPTLDELIRLADHPRIVAIGETGLDYHYTAESADIQKQSLRTHIEAAQKSSLPLIIHARAADEDMADILKSEYRNAPFSCVMHCFSSSPELGRTALDLGFYLSMSGIATFPKSQEVRDIFAAAPLDRILVETDAPYLAPPPYRGKRNEPAYTAFTAQVGADVFGMAVSEFAAQTEANFERLFWKAA